MTPAVLQAVARHGILNVTGGISGRRCWGLVASENSQSGHGVTVGERSADQVLGGSAPAAGVSTDHDIGPDLLGEFPDQVGDAIRLDDSGWSLARIGGRLSVNPIIVLNRLRAHGIPTRDTHGRPRS
jgi:hypothetical protein